MNIAPVAYRYARSLMQLAIEQGQLVAVQEDMRLVANTCEGSRDLVRCAAPTRHRRPRP